MIYGSFDPVYDNNNVVVKYVLTIRFNNKIVNQLDFPPDSSMTQDDIDNYLAGKFSGILS